MDEDFRRIETFLASLPTQAEQIPNELRDVARLARELRREEFRIVFFGAAKAGKSTLLNRLIGIDLIPVQGFRTSPTLARLRYGAPPEVTIVDGHGEAEIVSLDEVLRRPSIHEDPDNVASELRVTLPLPFLQAGVTLVDTPGILEREDLSETISREVMSADLAVMVLAADKILSAQERRVAWWASSLLNGNVVFPVNRMDAVEPGDREEVIEWARTALAGMGNAIVGQPQVLPAGLDAPFTHSASPYASTDFESWILRLIASPVTFDIAAASRLGVLSSTVEAATVEIGRQREGAAEAASQARLANLERTMIERSTRRRTVADARIRLAALVDRIPDLGSEFLQRIWLDTRRRSGEATSSGSIVLDVMPAVEDYAETLQGRIAMALLDAPITPPRLDLSRLVFRLETEAPDDPTTRAAVDVGDFLTRIVDGGRAGRDAGATVGRWIGKNVLGRDAEAALRGRVDELARQALISVEREARNHISRLIDLLDEVDAYYAAWTRSSPEVDQAERDERYWSALLQWCEGLARATQTSLTGIRAQPSPSSPRGDKSMDQNEQLL